MEPQDFLLLADQLPEGLLMVTGDGGILAVNRAARRQLQQNPRNLIGRNLTDVTEMVPDQLSSRLRPCNRTRTPVQLALKFTPRQEGLPALSCHGFLLAPGP